MKHNFTGISNKVCDFEGGFSCKDIRKAAQLIGLFSAKYSYENDEVTGLNSSCSAPHHFWDVLEFEILGMSLEHGMHEFRFRGKCLTSIYDCMISDKRKTCLQEMGFDVKSITLAEVSKELELSITIDSNNTSRADYESYIYSEGKELYYEDFGYDDLVGYAMDRELELIQWETEKMMLEEG